MFDFPAQDSNRVLLIENPKFYPRPTALYALLSKCSKLKVWKYPFKIEYFLMFILPLVTLKGTGFVDNL